MGDTDDFTSWAVSIRFPDAKPIDRVKFQFISGRLLIALILVTNALKSFEETKHLLGFIPFN